MRTYITTICLGISCMISAQSSHQADYTIKLLVGDQMKPALPYLADFRLTSFREYPYLYDGTLEEEQAYCKDLMTFAHAAIAVAYQGDQVVGLLSGASLIPFSSHFGEVDGFKTSGYDPGKMYYFAEIIVLPEYRGRGLGRRLFQEFEAWVVSQGYTHGCFISESYDMHPLKPKNYREHDIQWRSMRYEKVNVSVTYSWNTIQPDGSSRLQEHVMPYWVKTFGLQQ